MGVSQEEKKRKESTTQQKMKKGNREKVLETTGCGGVGVV